MYLTAQGTDRVPVLLITGNEQNVWMLQLMPLPSSGKVFLICYLSLEVYLVLKKKGMP